MKVEKSVKWTLESGKTIECKITATCEVNTNTAYADGWNIDLGKKTYQETTYSVYVDGELYKRCFAPSIVEEPIYSAARVNEVKDLGCVAILADVVAITQDIYDQITAAAEAAQKEASSDKEYAILKAKEDVAEKEEIEKEKASEANYVNHIENGLCPKCGSYCYGDCGVHQYV